MSEASLVVGAGSAGACHARELAEAGWRVEVIDRPHHIAGNAFDEEDRYFPADRFQLLPRDGYTPVFASILDHPAIRVSLGVGFDYGILRGVAHCFNSMAIGEVFGFALSPLPYRSLRFHHRDASARR